MNARKNKRIQQPLTYHWVMMRPLFNNLLLKSVLHIRDCKKTHPGSKQQKNKPGKHYYSHSSDNAKVEEAEKNVNFVVNDTSKTAPSKGEHALYPERAEYLWSEFRIYSKHIDEKRAFNTHGPKGNNGFILTWWG